ncbi:MAG: hypothetical protein ABIO94_03135 [Opitutaceae bacterium]
MRTEGEGVEQADFITDEIFDIADETDTLSLLLEGELGVLLSKTAR